MTKSGKNVTEAVATGLPRRAAMQGIAGSLAGIAALGAVGASAKKKKNKKVKGTLVRVVIEENDVTIPINSTDDVTANCPEPGGNETVFVLGGGFDILSDNADVVFMRESRATSDATGWLAEAANTSATDTADLTAQAICGYFRK
jgi:hypothetical protein